MAPACPFITEHLYQNLKKLRPSHATDGSIHFQMIPEVDESLINLDIEDAVANMTNVIKLGRTIRDQKVKNNDIVGTNINFFLEFTRKVSVTRSRSYSTRSCFS